MGGGVAVIIPALNEESSVGQVVADIPKAYSSRVIVVDNGSSDDTASVARAAGAQVISQPHRGYGRACLAGIATLSNQPPEILVFLDGDYSDYPEQMDELVAPIASGEVDFVVGSRMAGTLEPGAMPVQARFGNWLAGTLIKWGWGAAVTDLGPFRAIRYSALERLQMQDPTYGWTVEMQLKALEAGLRYREVPVDYRRRVGQSKVSGTVRGTLGASWKIMSYITRYWATRGQRTYAGVDVDAPPAHGPNRG